MQQVPTDGAHAAAFFASASGERRYLAVAELGDRQANTYRRDSSVYAFEPTRSPPLVLAQRLSTKGATDFHAFALPAGADGGTAATTTYLAVSNEQDDTLGGDIGSTIWRLQAEAEENADEDGDASEKDEV